MGEKNAGRAAASMTAEQWAWVEGMLRQAVGKHASPVRRIIAHARARAEATVSQRSSRVSVMGRIAADLAKHGPSRGGEIAARLEASTGTVSTALSKLRRQGRISRQGRVWSVATAPVRLVAR